MRKWKRFLPFYSVFLVLVIVGVFLLWRGFVAADGHTGVNKVPELRLTLNGTTLDEIKGNDKDIKYVGNWLEIGNLTFDNVKIKGRGNATWASEKKPYQLKLSQKSDLLGLGRRRKWILISNYWDYTNLRTDAAFFLARMVGENFTYSGEFVEFYVDDKYEGLYYLTQGIEIGKNAVYLRNPLGILVELDNIYGKEESSFFITNNGECLTIKDVVVQDNADLAMADFMKNFNLLETAIKEQDYASITEIIDVESFVQYYLISEFTANPDAYFTSQYFYKNGVDDKIHAGPVWDFDIAFNNVKVRNEFMANWDMTKSTSVEYFSDSSQQYGQWSRLFVRLIEFPEFETEVKNIFQERMSGRKYKLLSYISRRAVEIYDAAIRESEKWEKGDYIQSVKKLLKWVNDRYDYFEEEYGNDYRKNAKSDI